MYDDSIMSKSATFDPDTIAARMRELAFLNSSATLKFRALKDNVPKANGAQHLANEAGSSTSPSDGQDSNASSGEVNTEDGPGSPSAAAQEESPADSSRQQGASSSSSSSSERVDAEGWRIFKYTGGLKEYVTWLNRDKKELHEPVFVTKNVDGVQVRRLHLWVSGVQVILFTLLFTTVTWSHEPRFAFLHLLSQLSRGVAVVSLPHSHTTPSVLRALFRWRLHSSGVPTASPTC